MYYTIVMCYSMKFGCVLHKVGLCEQYEQPCTCTGNNLSGLSVTSPAPPPPAFIFADFTDWYGVDW